LLDSAFRVPGTNWRMGWDPILGLVPGIGDALTPLFSCLLMVQAFQMRIPKVVQLRMLLNVAIDITLGLVLVIGDFFDFAWKANDRNFRLLERHAYQVTESGAGDYAFVIVILGSLLLLVLVPLMLVTWMLGALGRSWL
jgi:Domain of unknown function (DUF4112)